MGMSGANYAGSHTYQTGAPSTHRSDYGTGASWHTDPGGWLAGKLGFGPGPSWTPEQAAAANQQAHDLAVQRATDKINSIFNNPNRKKQYADLGAATTKFYTDKINRQKAKNDLAMKFALARGGQTGSSQQAYDTKIAGEDYLNGILDASRRGQSAASALQQSDQQAKAQLLSEAASGINLGQAASQGAEALRANLEHAKAAATAGALGNVFANLANMYQQSRQAAQDRNANHYLYNLLYGNGGYGAPAGGW